MTLVYTLKPSFQYYQTDTKTGKIDDSILEIFKIILANFQIEDKLEKAKFF